jgi:nucleoside phosphorylase
MRALRVALVVVLLSGLLSGAAAVASPSRCAHPVLLLSAMPLELNPLVAKATITSTTHVQGRTFYGGRLAGVDVVMALTGIGPVNATRTSTVAFTTFRCSFAATVFSGVAGSSAYLGDVMVPSRWTSDGGKHYVGTSPGMYAVARTLRGVKLSADVPVGDAACLCGGVDAATPVHLPHQPQLRVGGAGETSDPFGGAAAPCTYGGGDIAGCEPCVLTGDPARDTEEFAGNAAGIPALLVGALQPLPTTTSGYAAQDEETGAVDLVARRHGVPFLGIRSVSDGQGDPLHLPGFPVQFAVYRQLAGNNAAAVTVAFLRAWARGGRPV